MSELGQWLRETRQAKALSLEDVEARTRIRALFLNALEEEDYDQLPGEIYTKGFLRNYALFLDLDPEEVLKKYQERDDSHRSTEPNFFRPLEVALSRTVDTRLRDRLLLLVLIAGLITVGLWAWKTGRLAWPPPLALFQRTATATHTPTQTPARSPQLSPTATAQWTATPRPSPTLRSTPATRVLAAPTSTATPTRPPTATLEPTASTAEPSTPTATLTSQPGIGVTLSITITEASWVEVTADSRNVFRGLMQAGEQGTWEARREIRLLLGNAGGVEVAVNDASLGTLGERQQVIELAWGPEGIVTPEPTATATPEEPTVPPEIPLP